MKIPRKIALLTTAIAVMGSLLLLSADLSAVIFNRLLVCSFILALLLVVKARGKVSQDKQSLHYRMNPKTARQHD